MVSSNFTIVLNNLSESTLAIAHTSTELACGLGQSVVKEGVCHALQNSQAQLSVTGVRLQHSLLPGEVVS